MKKRLLLHPKDWPWSSWLHYAKGEMGLMRIDSLVENNGSRVRKKRQKLHPWILATRLDLGAARAIYPESIPRLTRECGVWGTRLLDWLCRICGAEKSGAR